MSQKIWAQGPESISLHTDHHVKNIIEDPKNFETSPIVSPNKRKRHKSLHGKRSLRSILHQNFHDDQCWFWPPLGEAILYLKSECQMDGKHDKGLRMVAV